MDDANPLAEAVLTEAGKVKRVGSNSDFSGIAPGRKINLQGMTVVPGFVDCHVHLLAYGLALNEVDLTPARTIDDVLDMISKAKSDSVLIRVSQLEPDSIREERYPTREELDSLFRDRAVFVKRRDEHSSVLNSAAFELLAISPEIPNHSHF